MPVASTQFSVWAWTTEHIHDSRASDLDAQIGVFDRNTHCNSQVANSWTPMVAKQRLPAGEKRLPVNPAPLRQHATACVSKLTELEKNKRENTVKTP